jgi:DNA-binding winged helix-turn-helix (wHTH) protein
MLMVWGDPSAVAEMTRLAKEGYDAPIFIVGRPETESDRKALRYRGLRGELKTALVEKLREGLLVATGYDSRASLAAPPATIPADRWRVLAPSFEESSAAGGGLAISGILVSSSNIAGRWKEVSVPEPRLRIVKAARRARFDGSDLNLSPRSFNLLMILAEGVIQGAAPVEKRLLENKLLAGTFSEKAVCQAINRLKRQMKSSGVERENAQSLIENIRAVGYRLRLSASDIQVDD